MPRSWLYTPLRTFDPEINPGTEKPPAGFLVTRKVRILLLLLLVFSALFSFGAGLTGSFSITYRHDNKPPTSCLSAPKRREWRSLSRSEKTEYINAVQCLRTTPSVLSLPQTLYDDFPYVHMHVGNATHDTAGFLPWHRYFLHVYETALRNWCNYTGQLTYWDWTLDWADFRSAPVWDAETGFGGDGGLDAPRSVGEGRCVVDGPFAGLKALYSNLRKRPHCLARGFPGEKELKRWNAEFTPEKVEAVLGAKRYEDFNLGLENGPHLAIPYSVRGDFYRFTAPYDPVFFLHHVQLDRLWWRWQREDAVNKILFEGMAWDGSGRKARMDDVLSMSDIAHPVSVGDVMNTESNLLCYRY